MEFTFIKGIPHERLLLYVAAACWLPILAVAFFLWVNLAALQDTDDAIETLSAVIAQKEKKQAVNRSLAVHYRDADHYYIDKELETLKFLQPELASLQELFSDPNFTSDEHLHKRFERLSGAQNRLAFVEGAVQSTPLFTETTESLAHPVEVDSSDLQKILTYIEGVPVGPFEPPPGRPQLTIIDFKLQRKSDFPNHEVYELNMKLLKREFS
jgi:hypothetical protein